MMKRIAFFTIALALGFMLSGCNPSEPAQPDGAGVLRYDGCYCYIMDFDNDGLTNNYALRFYEDGTVIHASVEQKKPDGNYYPSADWFNRESEYYADLLGHYELDGDAITLTTYSPKGSVDYYGTVRENKLVLNSHSNVNGYEVSGGRYVFHPFDASED